MVQSLHPERSHSGREQLSLMLKALKLPKVYR
jgi:hypothetical protein